MGQVAISGALTAGPPTAGEGFPGALLNVPLGTLSTPAAKPFGVATGILQHVLNTQAPSFFVLRGVGSADTVTRGNLLYAKCNAPVRLRLTQDDGAGGDVVSTLHVHGLVLLEFEDLKFLKQLEAQGAATLEYFVSGTQ